MSETALQALQQQRNLPHLLHPQSSHCCAQYRTHKQLVMQRTFALMQYSSRRQAFQVSYFLLRFTGFQSHLLTRATVGLVWVTTQLLLTVNLAPTDLLNLGDRFHAITVINIDLI